MGHQCKYEKKCKKHDPIVGSWVAAELIANFPSIPPGLYFNATYVFNKDGTATGEQFLTGDFSVNVGGENTIPLDVIAGLTRLVGVWKRDKCSNTYKVRFHFVQSTRTGAFADPNSDVLRSAKTLDFCSKELILSIPEKNKIIGNTETRGYGLKKGELPPSFPAIPTVSFDDLNLCLEEPSKPQSKGTIKMCKVQL